MTILQHELFDSKKKRGRKFTTDPAPKGKKQCTKCRKVKPIASFSRDKNRCDGLYPQCRQCIADRDKERRVQLKASSWQRHYGLSEVEYWRLFEQQCGICAICGQPETKLQKGVVAHLSVDHDHTTGAVRGLLCMNCNIAIGYFRDDVDRMEQAIAYLRKWK